MACGCMSLDSRERRSACRVRICPRSGSHGSGMYQYYHALTDTKQPFPPLLHEFFFRSRLRPWPAIGCGTFNPSVAALVIKLKSDSAVLQLVNLSPFETRDVIVQAGT